MGQLAVTCTVENVDNHNQDKKTVQGRLKNKVGNYLVINTLDKRALKGTTQKIKEAHQKIFDIDPGSGLVKRVKFESPQLKYNLTEFFDNVPVFNEQVPRYDQVKQDEIIELPQRQPPKNITDGSVSKRYLEEINNSALLNRWQSGGKIKRNPNESLWNDITKLTFNKQMQTEVMAKLRSFRENLKIQQFKDLNTPFKYYQLDELKRLFNVAEQIQKQLEKNEDEQGSEDED